MLEFPALLASAEKGDRQEGEGRLLSFSTPTLGQFSQVSVKALYMLCVKVRNIRLLRDISQHQWNYFFKN